MDSSQKKPLKWRWEKLRLLKGDDVEASGASGPLSVKTGSEVRLGCYSKDV